MALRWQDVDLATGVIRVERSWDAKEGVVVEPKSNSGRRKLPIAAALRDPLVEHKLRSKGELVLSRPDGSPLNPTTSSGKARRGHGETLVSSRSRFMRPISRSPAS
jgi:hypothetical protein